MKKKAFTLIELLTVVAIVSMLMAILFPAFRKAKLRARVVAANADMAGIALALEAFALDNNNCFPSSRVDCSTQTRAHVFSLPDELTRNHYLPSGKDGSVNYAKIMDRFNKGITYKYISPGPRYDNQGTPLGNQWLKIPKGFPLQEGQLVTYDDYKKSPVKWVVFSPGPNYNKADLENGIFPLQKGYPFKKEFLFDKTSAKGALVRIRMANEDQIGTFSE